MEGIMDLLRQQLQVTQASLGGARPIIGQDEQVQAFSAVPEGNTSRNDTPTVLANGNEGRTIAPER